MNFPLWDVPLLGGGMLIGMIAIVHVFVSHFAIGGGLYLVLAERRARRDNDAAMLQVVKRHSLFFILVILVFGAVTGVAIWWTIALVHPSATSALIHTFVWAWAIEWVFFIVELIAAFIYYYGWDRMDGRSHMLVGWVYFWASWLSLVVINGILTFMLTTGKWVETHSVADGYFNPTMWPSMVLRTGVCVALAGIYALITCSLLTDLKLKEKMTRFSAQWLIWGILVVAVAGVWYVSVIPEEGRRLTMGGAPVVMIFTMGSLACSALLLIAAYLGPYKFPKQFHVTFAFVLAALGLMTTGMSEWVREAIRKPYVIQNYMYSNGILKREQAENADFLQDVQSPLGDGKGLLSRAKWSMVTAEERAELATLGAVAVPADKDVERLRYFGQRVFRAECQSCHTVNGFNGIKYAVKGWEKPFIDSAVQRLSMLKGQMPPFLGTDAERRALIEWLANLNEPAGAAGQQ